MTTPTTVTLDQVDAALAALGLSELDSVELRSVTIDANAVIVTRNQRGDDGRIIDGPAETAVAVDVIRITP